MGLQEAAFLTLMTFYYPTHIKHYLVMKYILSIIILLGIVLTSTDAQTMLQKSLANHKHGIVLTSSSVLIGSEINFRPGLGIGYTYFGYKYNMKSLVEYSQWSKPKGDFTIGEFRFSFKYEYERYINNWFSLGLFTAPEFRYSENFYPDNDPRNTSEVSYALGLGLSPKIYHLTDRYYFSFGLDLPIMEAGYFQEEGPDPDASNLTTFTEGFGMNYLSKEVRAVATFGYKF